MNQIKKCNTIITTRVAHYNMNRIRFEWTQIWKILRHQFVAMACHPSFEISSFSVDSLRQISEKILEREELGHYLTQIECKK